MTEAEWLNCPGPYLMLEFLQGRISERKFRLFGCACCRRIWHLISDDRSRRAVEVAERYADGLASRKERDEASGPSRIAVEEIRVFPDRERPLDNKVAGYHAALAAMWLLDENIASWEASTEATKAVRGATRRHSDEDAVGPERTQQAILLRDITGNPFKPLAVHAYWKTTAVVALARAIYEDMMFDALPILADALEEAGCDDADVLSHCRLPGLHAKGC